MKEKLTSLVVVAILLAACGSPGSSDIGAGSPTADPEAPVSSTPDPNEPTPTGDGAEPVEPVDGLLDVRPHGWDKVKVSADDRTVTVYYYSGVRECYGLDHVEVEYGEKKVTITLFEGRDPGAEVCIELAQYFKTEVELSESLADRKIVDGAR